MQQSKFMIAGLILLASASVQAGCVEVRAGEAILYQPDAGTMRSVSESGQIEAEDMVWVAAGKRLMAGGKVVDGPFYGHIDSNKSEKKESENAAD